MLDFPYVPEIMEFTMKQEKEGNTVILVHKREIEHSRHTPWSL